MTGLLKKILPQFLGGNPYNYQEGNTKANTKECAKYSNAELRKMGIRSVGDAWNRYPDKGYGQKTISNGFHYVRNQKPKEFDRKSYEQYLNNAADSVKKYIDPSKLMNGDVVSLYYKGSPSAEKAFKNGKVASSTHTGHVVRDNDQVYIQHNVSGNIHKNKIEDVLGGGRNWGVTQVMRYFKK